MMRDTPHLAKDKRERQAALEHGHEAHALCRREAFAGHLPQQVNATVGQCSTEGEREPLPDHASPWP